MYPTRGAKDIWVPLCEGRDSIFPRSCILVYRAGEKWLLVLLYTLTSGIYKRLWFLHIITNTDHCLSSLLQLTQRNVQCTLMQMSVRPNGSTMDLSTLVHGRGEVHVEDRGQFCEAGHSFHLYMGSADLSSGCQAWVASAFTHRTISPVQESSTSNMNLDGSRLEHPELWSDAHVLVTDFFLIL